MAVAISNGRKTVIPVAVITSAKAGRLRDARAGAAEGRVGDALRVEADQFPVVSTQLIERRCAMSAMYYAGEDKVPPGTFH